ncbi:MAG: TIM barrel protein [Planctomycetes bacterium]|nr:TIM barrel protein [Planctomycetota bacterium]
MSTASLHCIDFDPAQLTQVKAAGYAAIDIPVASNQVVSFDDHLQKAQEMHSKLIAADLECSIVRSACDIDDISVIVQAVEIAQALNSEFITVPAPVYDGSTPYRSLLADARACYQDLNQISSETGIDSLISINPGSICATVDALMRVIEGLDPSHVGVIYNPSQSCAHDIHQAMDTLGPFLRHIEFDHDCDAAIHSSSIAALKDYQGFTAIHASLDMAATAIALIQ